jgi:serine/threonine protein kinase/Tfp pilus assembly protein PilF
MGVVNKADDLTLKRSVALKFLSANLLTDPDQKARFMREAQAVAALDHPNISTIHEIHEENGHTFIVMAYIDGEDLGKKLQAGKLDVTEALDIAIQVARGISKAHSEGIVHRDIKPGNILITSDSQVKVVDFGLAKLATYTKLTKTGTSMGTVRYMSPEQAYGDNVDHRADIWSLGVVLYEMLAGQIPFQGEAEAAIFYSIVNEDPLPLTETRKDVTGALEDIVDKAIAKHPEKRFETMDEFLSALEKQRDQIALGIKDREFRGLRRLKRRKRLTVTIAAVIVLIAAVILTQRFYTKSMEIDSIAVLPFSNLSGDKSQEYYSDGMTSTLINELQKMSALKVISRTTAMRFKDTDKSLPEIASELNVDAIIEASVLRDGNSVHITAQLVRADPEEQLWADSYTRDVGDVLTIHSEVVQSIAERIKLAVSLEEQELLAHVYPVNPEAYEAYLIGKSFVDKWSQDAVEKGIRYLEKALEHDSLYARAYAGLATAHLYSASVGGGWRSPSEAIPMARAAATRALELDRSLAEAHMTLGVLTVFFDWDIERGESELKRAIELDPGLTDVRIAYAAMLKRLGGKARYDEAFNQLEQTLRTDPLNPWARAHLVWTHLDTGNRDLIYEEYQDLLDLNPEPILQAQGIIAMAFFDLGEGRVEEALAGVEQSVELTGRRHPGMLTHLGVLYASLGRHADAREILSEVIALAEERYVSPVLFARFHAAMGNIDGAFEDLERAYELRCGYLFFLPGLFPQLEADPRWNDLVKRVGLPDKAPNT